jgi:uroporphyrinogen-III synthase
MRPNFGPVFCLARSAPASAPLQRGLAQLGCTLLHQPMLQQQLAQPSAQLHADLEQALRADWAVCMSPFAVHALQQLAPQWFARFAHAWAAVGPATAAALRAALERVGRTSARIRVPAEGEGAAALWQSLIGPQLQPELQSGMHCALFLAPQGVQILQDQLRAYGCTAQEIALYQRQPLSLPAPLKSTLQQAQKLLFYAGSGAHLQAFAAQISRPDVIILAPSARIVALAQNLGFTQVCALANGNDQAILQPLAHFLGSLESIVDMKNHG